MINCHLQLYGSLRDSAPVAKGSQFDLKLPDRTTIADVIAMLKLTEHLHVAVNGELVTEREHLLSHDDKLEIFRPAAGG